MTERSDPDPEHDPDLEAILGFLRDRHGVDFSGYKRPSLRRLVGRRMSAAGAPDLRSYLDLLEANPAEVRTLFDGLLINVTAFFRDGAPWDALRDELLPQLVAGIPAHEPIRVWSAACATGEEAYSLAILLHQVLGEPAFRARVKVYATDIDEAALAVARSGRYAQGALEGVPPQVLAEYFVAEGKAFAIRHDLRQSVVFGRHDLLADAPISRIALLSCRNVLMYLTPDTQAQVLERFAHALTESGLLLLGKAEMLLSRGDLFTPVSLQTRIFRVNRRPGGLRYPGLQLTRAARETTARRVVEAAFISGLDAQVVLDRDSRVAAVNGTALRELGVSATDVGRPFEQLELSYRPLELRSVVERVRDTGQPVAYRDVPWSRPDHGDGWWDVQVVDLPTDGEGSLGVQITFVEVSRYHQLRQELTRTHADLQEAYEELQSTNEELETTNEELQSAIEELETTNEELQSTNEELETMNEELQSTNEELQTVNDELRERTTEVAEVNALLEGMLAGLQTAVAVLDGDLRVLVWNARAERMWGLRTFEVEGVALMRLHGGLPTDTLHELAADVLAGTVEDAVAEVELTNRFGRLVACSLRATPLRDRAGQVRGAIVAMDEREVIRSVSPGGAGVG